MRYVQLRAFHNVAVHGGFSRAAEALSLTQPAISDQVRKLEEEYDILLFNRRKKKIAVTESGQTLLEITNRLFEIENRALEFLSESRALSAGRLRIIADSTLHLLHVLKPFREKYPGVRVSLRSGNTGEVIDALFGYRADIGVLGDLPKFREFETVRLTATPLVAFAAIGTQMDRIDRLSLRELADYPLVLRESGSKTREKLEKAAGKSGIRLVAAIEAEGREAIREIVASGAGIGIVSQAEFGHDSRLRKIKIGGPRILMEEALICLRERSGGKLIGAFMDMAKEPVTLRRTAPRGRG